MISRLKTTTGKELVIKTPDSLSDISLSSKIAYDEICDKFATESEDHVSLSLMIEAIAEVSNTSINDLEQIDIADLMNANLDLSSLEFAITKLFKIINVSLNKYEFEHRTEDDYEFRYKGEVWKIPYLIRTTFNNRNQYTKISVQQSVEVLKIHKLLNATKISADERFTNFLRIFSILVFSDEHPLPLDSHSMNMEVERRMEFVEDIDAKTAYDVYFFLNSTMLT